MNIGQIRARRAEIARELRALHESASGDALEDAAQARWTTLESEARSLDNLEERAAQLDAIDRRASGAAVGGSGDSRFDSLAEGVGLLDVIRAQMGGTDTRAGAAREVSAELARRSGRSPQGLLWGMGAAEQRTLLTTNAGAIVPTDYRPELFIDRLRNATRVRALGATVLSDLTGNVAIPKRTASVSMGWANEDQALAVSDPAFGSIGLTPRHAGCISELSRQMIMQASPDVEQLARADMAAQLAEVLDQAAVAGTGANAQPTGILNTLGVTILPAGTNGGSLNYDLIADLVGAIDDANADGGTTGFLGNTKVRRALSKIKDSSGKPLGLDVLLQGKAAAWSNVIASNGTKGSGSGLSSLVYGNWSELLIGVWSSLDVLVNPYVDPAYSKGNVRVRAMLSCDIAVRHPQSFAAITDAIA